jgi:hypothetical protein
MFLYGFDDLVITFVADVEVAATDSDDVGLPLRADPNRKMVLIFLLTGDHVDPLPIFVLRTRG